MQKDCDLNECFAFHQHLPDFQFNNHFLSASTLFYITSCSIFTETATISAAFTEIRGTSMNSSASLKLRTPNSTHGRYRLPLSDREVDDDTHRLIDLRHCARLDSRSFLQDFVIDALTKFAQEATNEFRDQSFEKSSSVCSTSSSSIRHSSNSKGVADAANYAETHHSSPHSDFSIRKETKMPRGPNSTCRSSIYQTSPCLTPTLLLHSDPVGA